jgi:hypothetical protein
MLKDPVNTDCLTHPQKVLVTLEDQLVFSLRIPTIDDRRVASIINRNWLKLLVTLEEDLLADPTADRRAFADFMRASWRPSAKRTDAVWRRKTVVSGLSPLAALVEAIARAEAKADRRLAKKIVAGQASATGKPGPRHDA